MGVHVNIYSDRQQAEAGRQLEKIDSFLSAETTFEAIRTGLPAELTTPIKRALERERIELQTAVYAYEKAKGGECADLMARVGEDLGERLIATRVCRGLSQKELARKLGIKEQAVQRWEADNYRSITIANFQNVARVLSLSLTLSELDQARRDWSPNFETPPEIASKVLRHARKRNWLDGAQDERDLVKRVGEHVLRFGTPSLLRTGLRQTREPNELDDWALIAWKTQVSWLAEKIVEDKNLKYDPLNLDWLPDLVRLTKEDGGAKKAQRLLEKVGIILIVEPQIAGMKIDGATFLLGKTPVIGLTLRRDSIDNFWFTLMHEIGHIILHYRAGLIAGFFDDFDDEGSEEVEKEADFFAQKILLPDHVWEKSVVRIAKDPAVIKKFADKIGIGSEIVFGRLRKEKNDYSIFSRMIGQGRVRRQFAGYEAE